MEQQQRLGSVGVEGLSLECPALRLLVHQRIAQLRGVKEVRITFSNEASQTFAGAHALLSKGFSINQASAPYATIRLLLIKSKFPLHTVGRMLEDLGLRVSFIEMESVDPRLTILKTHYFKVGQRPINSFIHNHLQSLSGVYSTAILSNPWRVSVTYDPKQIALSNIHAQLSHCEREAAVETLDQTTMQSVGLHLRKRHELLLGRGLLQWSGLAAAILLCPRLPLLDSGSMSCRALLAAVVATLTFAIEHNEALPRNLTIELGGQFNRTVTSLQMYRIAGIILIFFGLLALLLAALNPYETFDLSPATNALALSAIVMLMPRIHQVVLPAIRAKILGSADYRHLRCYPGYATAEPKKGLINTGDLEPGDSIRLETGDIVPADGTVTHILTLERLECTKLVLNDREQMLLRAEVEELYLGSHLRAGQQITTGALIMTLSTTASMSLMAQALDLMASQQLHHKADKALTWQIEHQGLIALLFVIARIASLLLQFLFTAQSPLEVSLVEALPRAGAFLALALASSVLLPFYDIIHIPVAQVRDALWRQSGWLIKDASTLSQIAEARHIFISGTDLESLLSATSHIVASCFRISREEAEEALKNFKASDVTVPDLSPGNFDSEWTEEIQDVARQNLLPLIISRRRADGAASRGLVGLKLAPLETYAAPPENLQVERWIVHHMPPTATPAVASVFAALETQVIGCCREDERKYIQSIVSGQYVRDGLLYEEGGAFGSRRAKCSAQGAGIRLHLREPTTKSDCSDMGVIEATKIRLDDHEFQSLRNSDLLYVDGEQASPAALIGWARRASGWQRKLHRMYRMIAGVAFVYSLAFSRTTLAPCLLFSPELFALCSSLALRSFMRKANASASRPTQKEGNSNVVNCSADVAIPVMEDFIREQELMSFGMTSDKSSTAFSESSPLAHLL